MKTCVFHSPDRRQGMTTARMEAVLSPASQVTGTISPTANCLVAEAPFLSPLPRYLAPLRRGFFLRLDMTERLLRRCPIPKTTRKAPSGVRTSSHATNGIAAFAVSASCTRRWYANTLPMSTMRPCRRACTNTSTAQFGGERNSHDLAANSCNTGGCPRGSRMVRSDVRRGGFRRRKTASLEQPGHGGDRFSLSFTPSTLARHRFPKPNDFSVLNVPCSRLMFLCIDSCLRERL